MSKAAVIAQYCNMSLKTPQSMEYFIRKKRASRTSKPIIKKEIYERHYLKGATFVNPNIEKLITRNRNTIERIMRVVANSKSYTR